MRADLPTGTVTFLFTDVEGSTRRLDQLGEAAYADALAEHGRLISSVCGARGGVVVDTEGDSFFVAFTTASDARRVVNAHMTRTYDHPRQSTGLLQHGRVATRLPAQDLQRARAWYAEKLGLEPVDERPGGLLYRCGGTDFALFASAGAPSGAHTQMGWEVEDLDAVVRELRGRGVAFEEFDFPGLRTVDGVAEVEGNYPSTQSTGERAVWFRDCEGNLIGIGQPIR